MFVFEIAVPVGTKRKITQKENIFLNEQYKFLYHYVQHTIFINGKGSLIDFLSIEM